MTPKQQLGAEAQIYESMLASRTAMKTVSHDDQLTQRGANPRTGLITPFVTGGGNRESTSNNYVAAQTRHAKWNHRSHSRWKQDDAGWKLTDSPLPSVVAQSTEQSRRATSVKSLQDKFVVDMPGLDNPGLPPMTMEQIRDYQEGSKSMDGRCRTERTVMDLTRTSIQSASSSTRRKEVGTGASPRRDRPTTRQSRCYDSDGLLQAQILNDDGENPFLGGSRSTTPPNQTIHINQYLSMIDLLHSSHFANLPLSYRPPSNLLPGRSLPHSLRSDVSVVDAASSRPKVQRQVAAINVPRVRQDTQKDELDKKAQQLRKPSAGVGDVATDGGANIELEKVRAKLRPSQLCKCSRCENSRTVSRDPTPILRVPSGNVMREPALKAKNGQEGAEFLDHTGSDIKGKLVKDEKAEHPAFSTDPPLSHQLDTKSSNDHYMTTPVRTSDLTRSAERTTILLSASDLAWIKRLMAHELQHVISIFRHTPSAVRVLKRGEVGAEAGGEAVKVMLLAVVYLLVLLKIIVTLVRVFELILDIMVVVSWPVRAVGVVVRCYLLGCALCINAFTR